MTINLAECLLWPGIVQEELLFTIPHLKDDPTPKEEPFVGDIFKDAPSPPTN